MGDVAKNVGKYVLYKLLGVIFFALGFISIIYGIWQIAGDSDVLGLFMIVLGVIFLILMGYFRLNANQKGK